MISTVTIPRFTQPAFRLLAALARQRRLRATRVALARLDANIRADIGLPPTVDRPLAPHEAAARLAMIAMR